MKKFGIFLLLISLVAGCFLFVGCDKDDTSCTNSAGHKFVQGPGVAACGECVYCYKSRCDVGEHQFVGGICYYCNAKNCDLGEHSYSEEGFCEYCGQERPTTEEDGEDPLEKFVIYAVIGVVLTSLIYLWGAHASSGFLIYLSFSCWIAATIGAWLVFGWEIGLISIIAFVIFYIITRIINRIVLGYNGDII